MNKYNIYVVNNMTTEQTFWCFLAAPQLSIAGNVYANSDAYLTVPSKSRNLNYFTVPVQYVLQAGASNRAVGLNIEINSQASEDVDLGDQWAAAFSDPAKHQGPGLTKYGTKSPDGTLQMQINNYDQAQEPIDKWYGSQTFGIETASGFIGVTWEPQAGKTTTITPILEFYVATGTYQANTLADMTTVSTESQTVSLTDFDAGLNCTVTLDSAGRWSVKPGKPVHMTDGDLNALLESHLLLSRAHESLVSTSRGAEVQPLMAIEG